MRSSGWSLAAFVLVASLTPAEPQTGGTILPPIAHTRSDLNVYLDLHNHLMVAARQSENALPEYRSEVIAYRQAREMANGTAAWRFVSDACVTGPDIKTIGMAAGNLPASFDSADRVAAKKMIEALVSAWPRFEAKDLVEHRRSLQNILVKVIRKHFSGQLEERIMTTLYDKLAFKPLDAPITLYPVIGAPDAGTWGRTAQGYYLVVPGGRMGQLTIIENLVHELTHVLDENQPLGSRTFLVRLRGKAAGIEPETVDASMHGLVSWNAGEMVRRFGNAEHQTYAELSPARRAKIEKFLPSYQGSWLGYIEGRLTADQAIDGLVAGMRAAEPEKAEAGAKPLP